MAMIPDKHNWLETELVQEHIRRAADDVGAQARDLFIQGWQYAYRPRARYPDEEPEHESPLEVVWQVWWDAYSRGINEMISQEFYLPPQKQVECGDQRFRLDFVVELVDVRLHEQMHKAELRWPSIAIELDGHAFHEKTLEQVNYRNKRDRLLQQGRWHVFHYSFSEMTGSPVKCISEVFEFCVAAYRGIQSELGRRARPELSAEVALILDEMDKRKKTPENE